MHINKYITFMHFYIQLGHSYLGEFLSPGYDCSDIMNHEPDASEGLFWITLGNDTKRKVSTCKLSDVNVTYNLKHSTTSNTQ